MLHVVSAGRWAGGLLALASLRPPGGWAGAEARTLLERFGRIAFIAFGVTALSSALYLWRRTRSPVWARLAGASAAARRRSKTQATQAADAASNGNKKDDKKKGGFLRVFKKIFGHG